VFAGFGLVAVGIIVLAAFGLINIFKWLNIYIEIYILYP
jgi:hypothetical protein